MPKLPFGFDRPDDSPGFLLWQATTLWRRSITRAIEGFGISHSQFVIMALLLWLDGNQQDTTQITLTEWSKLDKMTVSKSLKKLVDQGWVEREECQQDMRAKRVSLSRKGKALIKKVVPIVEGVDRQFFSELTSGDQKSVLRLLKKLIDHPLE